MFSVRKRARSIGGSEDHLTIATDVSLLYNEKR